MSRRSWTGALKETLARLQKGEQRPRVAIMGIGHVLRGDDAAGVLVARALNARCGNWDWEFLLSLDAGSAPENCTGRMRRFQPDLVLLIDAAELGERPGALRWLHWSETSGLSASTHTLPPYLLARYLSQELNCEVALLGIQPENTLLGAPVSPAVREAIDQVVAVLARSMTIDCHGAGAPANVEGYHS